MLFFFFGGGGGFFYCLQKIAKMLKSLITNSVQLSNIVMKGSHSLVMLIEVVVKILCVLHVIMCDHLNNSW